MLKINCEICKEEIEHPGTLLFPTSENKIKRKTPICKECHRELVKFTDRIAIELSNQK